MNVLRARDLAELEIPMPDSSTAEAIVEIVSVRESLREWLLDADEVLDSLYKTENAVAAKQDVLDVSRTLRARVELGHALDGPYERYRTTYPFPLAVGWRKVEAAYSGPDPESALLQVLDAAEVTMAYAACVALLFARSQGLELGCVKDIRKKLGTGRSGMGFGDWVNILNEATLSKQAKRVPSTAPLVEVRQFFDTPGVTEGRARLKKLRDAFAHGRRITGTELDEARDQSFQDLSVLMEAAAPLSDLGFILVDQARVDSIRGTTALRYREFRGDHPVVPYRETHVDGMQFEEGSLYLRDTDGGWHLMRPYLLSNPCPTCHAWSVF
ncbi:hypothetical protein, partial [Gemmatimonas sp.]|uniref:hypothetical protein n=1 Tax=Gemmatimonas sp. TaxID=1962908 RepID=UPI0035617507